MSGSTGQLILNPDPLRSKRFQWRSSDRTLGDIDTGIAQATSWQYRAATGVEPARLVFIGGGNGASVHANVLMEPYNRAVVDVVKGSRRVRYLLKLTACGNTEPSTD